MTSDRSPLATDVRRAELRPLASAALAPERPCERLGALAAQLLRATASFAVLIEGDRYVLVSSHGLPSSLASGQELPLARPFCNAVVAAAAPLAVPDWHEYAPLASDPAAAIPGATAYAGVPLVRRDGAVVGVLVLVDQQARPWASDELEQLRELAQLLVEEFELRSEIERSRQQSEDERTMLLTLLAHEFRTPLTSIKGFVELILDGEVGQVSEQQREFLAIVARNAERLIDLVNDRIANARPGEPAQ